MTGRIVVGNPGVATRDGRTVDDGALDGRAAGGVDIWWITGVVVVAAGILFHGVRAWSSGWLPAGDDGYWAIMARSVFSAHPPLLGSSSSGGLTTGTDFHHLGPLGFYLLAPFVALLGGVGVAVGSAVLNAAAAVLAPVAVRRSVGIRAGWLVLVGSALLAFTMGSELLVDPWNPHLATFAFWAGLCAMWAVLRGGVWWASVALVALSSTAQTHLSFVPLAGLAGAVTVVALGYWTWRRPVPPDASGPHRRWAPLAAAAATTLVANLPVLIQQFFSSDPGNLGRALTGSGDQGATIGALGGLRLMSQPLLQPWNWWPGTWEPQVLAIEDAATPWVLVAVAVALAVVLVVAWRRADTSTVVAVGVAGALLIAGAVVAGALPFRFFGAPMSLARWVWPLGLFVQVVLVDAVAHLVASRRSAGSAADLGGGRGVRVASSAGLAVVVVLTVANLPARDEGSGAVVAQHEAIRELLELAGPDLAQLDRPLVVVPMESSGSTATAAVLDWLDERGIDLRLEDPVVLRQAGRHRAEDGSATETLIVRGYVPSLDPPPEGFRTVARVDPLGPDELEWYLGARRRVEAAMDRLVERAERDPDYAQRIGVAPDSGREATRNWGAMLCGSRIELPRGNPTVQADVIDDGDRDRLCRLDRALQHGALSLQLGPPPGS